MAHNQKLPAMIGHNPNSIPFRQHAFAAQQIQAARHAGAGISQADKAKGYAFFRPFINNVIIIMQGNCRFLGSLKKLGNPASPFWSIRNIDDYAFSFDELLFQMLYPFIDKSAMHGFIGLKVAHSNPACYGLKLIAQDDAALLCFGKKLIIAG